MKKMFSLILIAMLALTYTGSLSVSATDYADLPLGKNYLDLDNLSITDISFSLVQPITINANTNYTLTFPLAYTELYFETYMADFNFWGSGGELGTSDSINSTNWSTYFVDNGAYGSTFTFNSGSSTSIDNLILLLSFGAIDSSMAGNVYFQLEEGSIGTAYEEFVVPVTSENAIIFADATDPITLFYIKGTLTSIDATDGDISATIINTVDNYTANSSVLGDYLTTWSSTDSAGNTILTDVTIRVVDTVAPDITLIGDNTVYVNQYENFTELGATWSDFIDCSGLAVVTGTVDINTLGTYTITYSITDLSGNVAVPITRSVIVTEIGSIAPVIPDGGTLTLFGIAWYWYAAGGIIAYAVFGTKKGRKAVGLK